jgi:hypothetical protein
MAGGMRRLPVSLASLPLIGLALLAAPLPAMAATKGLPQMNFSDPLTFIQIIWMAVIMIVLYIVLSRWALPQLGGVIEARAARITADLDAARQAKAEAEAAVAALNQSIRQARESGHSTIAKAVEAAKTQAGAQSDELNARRGADRRGQGQRHGLAAANRRGSGGDAGAAADRGGTRTSDDQPRLVLRPAASRQP